MGKTNSNLLLLSGLLATTFAITGCVYVPADLYYGTAPRPTPHREYYVEEYVGPIYPEPELRPRPDWHERRRREELSREESRGYHDQRRGRARTVPWNDEQYGNQRQNGARHDRNHEDGASSRQERRQRELEAERKSRVQSSPSQNHATNQNKTQPRLESTESTNQSDKTEVPSGTRTSNPNRVKSPFSPYNELDVTGLKSGSLARDPTTGKVFRVP